MLQVKNIRSFFFSHFALFSSTNKYNFGKQNSKYSHNNLRSATIFKLGVPFQKSVMKLFLQHNKGFRLWHGKAVKDVQQKQRGSCQKGLFFMHSRGDCICHHTHKPHMHIYPQLLTLNKKHQMYTSMQPYILFALTDFQQLLFPMQMSRLSPTPHRGEVI